MTRSLFAFLGAWGTRRGPSRHSRPAVTRRPQLEALETREVPSVSLPGPGTPGSILVVGTDEADQFLLRLASPREAKAPTLRVSEDGGANFHSVPLQDVMGVVFLGQGGDDRLVVDSSQGLVANRTGLPISYSGDAGIDELFLVGNPGTKVKESYVGLPSILEGPTGLLSITSVAGTQGLKFTGVESFVDTMTAASLTILGSDKGDLIMVRDGGVYDRVTTQLVDGGSAFMPISYGNKRYVTINALGGDDVIAVNSLTAADGLERMVLVGGKGFDIAAMKRVPKGEMTFVDLEVVE